MKRALFKSLTVLGIISLIFQSTPFLPDFLLSHFISKAFANDMCSVDVDVVLIMDRSGSMNDGYALSKCEWSEMKLYKGGSTWFLNTKYDVSEDWCNNVRNSFDESEPIFQYVVPNYTASSNAKIDNAKNAAKSFLDNFQTNDQSALVSFSDDATLDKSLSNSHLNTKTAIDNLSPFGSTNIGDAILQGIDELNSERANSKANHIMVILTDGKANQPNGDGYNEDPLDVQYAKDKAQEAADQGYKIFTVGLGSNDDINEPMLQEVASTTQAQYYHAPNGDGLSQIYDDIAWEVCQYGSISGCKFEDENKNNVIDEGEQSLSGWEIVLTGGQNGPLSQETSQDGCYTFAGLSDGNYTVSEGDNLDETPFTQTYPQDLVYENVEILDHNDVTDINFANYFPECGNEILDAGEECDQSNDRNCTTTIGYAGLQSCNDCSWGSCSAAEFCGDGITNGPEECDDGNTEDGDDCSSTCEIEEAEQVCGNNIQEGDEECDDGEDNGNHSMCSENCTLNPECNDGEDNDQDTFTDYPDDPDCTCLSDNQEQGTSTEPVCGDGIKEGDEECDDGNQIDGDGCSSNCMTEEEGIQPGDIVINEIMQNPSGMTVLIRTNKQWFELYNNSDKTVDLQGCLLKDNVYNSHVIQNELNINAGEYVVLGYSDNKSLNGNVDVDYVYVPSFFLSASSDQIILECDGIEINRVEYDNGATFPDPSGKSMILSDPSLDNNDGSNWCESTSSYGDDFGTPGSVNDPCGGIECQQTTTEECVSDGWMEIFYTWNHPACEPDTTEQVEDSSCACEYTEWTNDACIADGQMEQTRNQTTSFDYCTDTNQQVEDSNCDCDLVDETPGNCVSETHRLWNLTYNYCYCEPKTEQREDSSCASEPVCGDGELEGEEECDDGNTTDGDGCSSNCEEENGGPPVPTASIEGCKFLDSDNDGEISDETETLEDWEITLHNGNVPLTATTDEDGCYKFENLHADSYTISEDTNSDQQPYIQTYPASLSYSITLNEGQAKTDVDFGNYLPVCGNGILDDNYGEECDDGNESDGDDCSSSCNIEIPEDENECSISGYKFEDVDKDHTLDEGEEKLGGWEILLFKNNTSTVLKNQVTDEDGYYNFDHLEPGDYYVKEGDNASFEPFLQTYPTTTFHTLNLVYTENEEDINFGNYLPICGNGILDTMEGAEEECDDGNTFNGDGCSKNCTQETQNNSGGGGVGGSVYIPIEEEEEDDENGEQQEVLNIFNEADSLTGDTITITWETNLESDSRVIYSKESEGHVLDEDSPLKYGYAHSYENPAEEEVTFHTVEIPWLEPCTTYYYRDVSSLSTGGTAFNPERSFTTFCEESEEKQKEEEEKEEPAGTGGPKETITKETTEPETEEEVEATTTEEVIEATTTATTTPSNFLANLTNLLKDFTNKCFSYFPWWAVLVFALYPLYKFFVELKKKGSSSIIWFIWTLVHLLTAAIIFFSFSSCIPLWIFIISALGSLVLWYRLNPERDKVQDVMLVGLGILLALAILLAILQCLYLWLIALGVIGFVIFALSTSRPKQAGQKELPLK